MKAYAQISCPTTHARITAAITARGWPGAISKRAAVTIPTITISNRKRRTVDLQSTFYAAAPEAGVATVSEG
jgi:hypothetical protein